MIATAVPTMRRILERERLRKSTAMHCYALLRQPRHAKALIVKEKLAAQHNSQQLPFQGWLHGHHMHRALRVLQHMIWPMSPAIAILSDAFHAYKGLYAVKMCA